MTKRSSNVDSIDTNLLLFKVNNGKLVRHHSLKLSNTTVNIVASSEESVIVQMMSGSVYELQIKDQIFDIPVELFIGMAQH